MNKERDLGYLNKIKEQYPDFFENKKVLELGSRNINGSVREVFNNCEWVGLDWCVGNDVDVVCKNHDYKGTKDYFDVLISFSTFEHDFYWIESIEHNLEFLKKGGLILFSWCGMSSSPHGMNYGSNLDKELDITRDDPQFQEMINKKTNYFPKSEKEMVDLLKKNNITILDIWFKQTPEIGAVHYLTAKK
jgi:hypothetical protein